MLRRRTLLAGACAVLLSLAANAQQGITHETLAADIENLRERLDEADDERLAMVQIDAELRISINSVSDEVDKLRQRVEECCQPPLPNGGDDLQTPRWAWWLIAAAFLALVVWLARIQFDLRDFRTNTNQGDTQMAKKKLVVKIRKPGEMDPIETPETDPKGKFRVEIYNYRGDRLAVSDTLYNSAKGADRLVEILEEAGAEVENEGLIDD